MKPSRRRLTLMTEESTQGLSRRIALAPSIGGGRDACGMDGTRAWHEHNLLPRLPPSSFHTCSALHCFPTVSRRRPYHPFFSRTVTRTASEHGQSAKRIFGSPTHPPLPPQLLRAREIPPSPLLPPFYCRRRRRPGQRGSRLLECMSTCRVGQERKRIGVGQFVDVVKAFSWRNIVWEFGIPLRRLVQPFV